MATSVYKSILDARSSQIAALGLVYQNVAVPVAIRKLPRAEEGLDSVPLIAVVPDDRPPTAEPWTTENEVLVKYPTSAVLILPSNADYTDTDMDLTARFLEQIRRLFQWGLQGATLPAGVDLFNGEVLPKPLYDEGKLAQQYAYTGLSFRDWVVEPRTN